MIILKDKWNDIQDTWTKRNLMQRALDIELSMEDRAHEFQGVYNMVAGKFVTIINAIHQQNPVSQDTLGDSLQRLQSTTPLPETLTEFISFLSQATENALQTLNNDFKKSGGDPSDTRNLPRKIWKMNQLLSSIDLLAEHLQRQDNEILNAVDQIFSHKAIFTDTLISMNQAYTAYQRQKIRNGWQAPVV